MLKRVFHQSFYYLLTLGTGKVLSVVMFALLARILQPEGFGEISFFMSVSVLVTALGDLGLRQWYQKMMVNRPDEGLLARACGARLAIALLSCGLLALINPWWPGYSGTWLLLLAGSLLIEAGFTVADAYYLARQQSLKLGFKLIGRNLLLFAALPVLLWVNNEVTYYLIIYVVSMLVVLGFYFPWRAIKKFKWRDLFFGDDIWRRSATYGLMDGLSMAYSKIDSLLLERILGNAALGIYSSAYRVLEGFNLIPQALFHNLFPEAAKKNGIKLTQLGKMMIVMAGGGLILGGLTFLLADWVILILMGENYLAAGPILRIFGLVVFLFFVNAPLNIIIQGSDHLRQYLPWMTGIVLLNIGLNLGLIRVGGIAGAAWAMVFCQLALVGVNLLFVKRIYQRHEN